MKKQELQTAVLPRWLQTGATRELFEKEASFALQEFNKNGLLQKCTKESLLTSVFNVALTGLSLNPVLNYASLVPRWNSKDSQYEASLEPQYQGLIKLAIDSGKVKAFIVNVVYEGDELEMDYSSLKKVILHTPYFTRGQERGEIKAVYSIAVLKDGTELGEVMTWPEVQAIRDRSESWKAFAAGKIRSTPWQSDQAEMARKTVVKRQIKYLSKGDDQQKLMEAVRLDNEINGFRPFADANDMQFLTHLIEEEIKVDDRALNMLRQQMKAITFKDEALKLRDHIFDNYMNWNENPGQKEIAAMTEDRANRDE